MVTIWTREKNNATSKISFGWTKNGGSNLFFFLLKFNKSNEKWLDPRFSVQPHGIWFDQQFQFLFKCGGNGIESPQNFSLILEISIEQVAIRRDTIMIFYTSFRLHRAALVEYINVYKYIVNLWFLKYIFIYICTYSHTEINSVLSTRCQARKKCQPYRSNWFFGF